MRNTTICESCLWKPLDSGKSPEAWMLLLQIVNRCSFFYFHFCVKCWYEKNLEACHNFCIDEHRRLSVESISEFVFKYLLFEGKRWLKKNLIEASRFIIKDIMENLSITFKMYFSKNKPISREGFAMDLLCESENILFCAFVSNRIKVIIMALSTSPELSLKPNRTLYVEALSEA